MELPRRDRGDELLKSGELVQLRHRLRAMSSRHDLVSVIACAFDHRTRMLPFIYADTRMVPAGVRAIGSALVDAGFPKTRIVLQQWNPHFRPSQMRLDGRIPDLLLVSTMGMHSGRCLELTRDAHRIDPAHRPLIIAGGSHAVYEPGYLFNSDPQKPGGADVAVTGEEFVFLSLLEVLLSERSRNEPLRSVFLRCRGAGLLDGIPGLVYSRGDQDGVVTELIDTGVQRLLGDLDETPHPALGYGILEAKSSSPTLASKPLAANLVASHSPISSLVMTFGCKFACPYCPIPAYNQRQHRLKSAARIADEMWQLNKQYGLKYFFGTDDNFFNNKARTLDIVETLARAEFDGVPLRSRARWYSEVTVHDTLQMKDHLPLVRKSGCRALWLGVEDLTATLVNKGQSASKTTEAFQRLREVGICPMPMMMHHDSQPLYSRGSNYGLLNQIRILRKAGAVSLQVLMMTPSPGSKLYAQMFENKQVIASAGGRRAEPNMFDGNYVVASSLPRPWRKQINMLLGYLYFYNPVWFVLLAVRRKTRVGWKPALWQLVGMMGLIQSFRRTIGWAIRLRFGKIERLTTVPRLTVQILDTSGSACFRSRELEPVPSGSTPGTVSLPVMSTS